MRVTNRPFFMRRAVKVVDTGGVEIIDRASFAHTRLRVPRAIRRKYRLYRLFQEKKINILPDHKSLRINEKGIWSNKGKRELNYDTNWIEYKLWHIACVAFHFFLATINMSMSTIFDLILIRTETINYFVTVLVLF